LLIEYYRRLKISRLKGTTYQEKMRGEGLHLKAVPVLNVSFTSLNVSLRVGGCFGVFPEPGDGRGIGKKGVISVRYKICSGRAGNWHGNFICIKIKRDGTPES